ncbi:uncharacterized protein LOC118146302 isoform X1 [Callithrix jacchus]
MSYLKLREVTQFLFQPARDHTPGADLQLLSKPSKADVPLRVRCPRGAAQVCLRVGTSSLCLSEQCGGGATGAEPSARGRGEVMSQGAWAPGGLGTRAHPCAQALGALPNPTTTGEAEGGTNAGGWARRPRAPTPSVRGTLPEIAPSGCIRFRSPARCAHSVPA